jgi:elongation factor G
MLRFLADSINCLRASSGGVFVLNPSVGLRVESERLWAQANEDRVSRLLFVAKMDHEQANVQDRVAPLLENLEAKGVYLQMPVGAETSFKGVVDLIGMKAHVYEGDSGKFVEADIPADLQSAAEEWRQKMLEDVAETDDGLLEKFLDGQDLSVDELKMRSKGRARAQSVSFCSARHCAKSAWRSY